MRPLTDRLFAVALSATLFSLRSASADTTVATFDSFVPDSLYGSWSSATKTSGPTSYQVVASSGFGGAYESLPALNASGNTNIELTVTISGATGVTIGPLVSLGDADGTEWRYAWFGQTAGAKVLSKPLSATYDRPTAGTVVGLDLAHLTYIHIQVDPGAWSGQYTIAFENLMLRGSATPTNRPPIALDDTASTLRNTQVTILPLINDADPDGDTIAIASASSTHGQVAILGGTQVLFTPATRFTGEATITYTVSDSRGGTNSAVIRVNVTSLDAVPPKPIMAHYMPWFVAKPYSGAWGYHWTLNSRNPDLILTNGQRQIASHYYPLIGPYDSLDPAVLEYHVLLMKLGGLDGVIADWYGHESYFDYGPINQRTSALQSWARKAGLKFTICYEDRTVQAKISAGYIPSTAAVANAQQSMLHLQTNYFGDPSYLRLSGQPVLLDFGPVFFTTNSQWTSIFSVLSNQPAFFTENQRYAAGVGAFTWPPMHLSGGGTLATNQLNSYLDSFESSANGWPAFVSSAFPRFHDFYAQAGLTSYGYLEDRGGLTLRDTLSRAMTNGSDVVQLVTWNDFGEGTVIEPTTQFGYRDLGIVQDLRRQYREPAFPNQTNDLALAGRQYALRRLHATNAVISAELDRVFTNLITGKLVAARAQLAGVESRQPAMYDLASNGAVFRFSIGGFLSGGSTQVQATSNLAMPNWATAATFTTSTNLLRFSTPVATQGSPAFFKVRSSPP